MSSKVSHDDDHLDFAKIEAEVQNAVVSDEKYWRENDAKIRAVEQRVPTYDDFREMVLAAHLKPLQKGDRISDIGRFTQVWNQTALGQKFNQNTPQENREDQFSLDDMCMPSTDQEFVRTWKHLSKNKEDQKNYLLIVGPERLGTLFKTEITGSLLGEFFYCLQSVKDSEVEVVVKLLNVFTKSTRFSLSLAFLSKSEKTNGAALFTKVKDMSHFDILKDIDELERKYKLS